MISERAMWHRLNNQPARRVTAVAPPGSLLKRHHANQPRQMRAEEATGRDAAYLDLVRQCPCLKCGMEPSEAAHVRYASAAFEAIAGAILLAFCAIIPREEEKIEKDMD